MGDEQADRRDWRHRRLQEDRTLDDWTVHVDSVLSELAHKLGDARTAQRSMSRELTLVGTAVRTLQGDVDGLRQASPFTPEQIANLVELASERMAEKVIERRQEFLGSRWQRRGVIAALLCAPLSVVVAALALVLPHIGG